MCWNTEFLKKKTKKARDAKMSDALWEMVQWVFAPVIGLAVLIQIHYMLKKYIWPGMWPKDKRYWNPSWPENRLRAVFLLPALYKLSCK